MQRKYNTILPGLPCPRKPGYDSDRGAPRDSLHCPPGLATFESQSIGEPDYLSRRKPCCRKNPTRSGISGGTFMKNASPFALPIRVP
ncbi:MAG: hypothetical protein H6Q05_108 [Acidobacteria bacterium]|nr:hypothetical protein [Acidobacteriota bacterium]